MSSTERKRRCGLRDQPREFSSAETRRIGSFPGNTVLADSEGRGWRDVHASLATVTTWSGVHRAQAHDCIAYCVNQPALLRRRLEGGREESMTIRPRQFFVIPGRSDSEWHRGGRTEMLMIYVRKELLERLAGELSSSGGGHPAADLGVSLGATDPLLEQFALTILDILRQEEDGTSALYVDAFARASAIHLLRRRGHDRRLPEAAARRAACRPGLRRIRDYIEDDLGGDLSLGALAKQAGVPPTIFGRSFRQLYGTSPHQYVLSRRLERARVLLLSTDLSVAEISLDTGFSSQSHLTTAFGRLTGMPPAEFRRVAAAM